MNDDPAASFLDRHGAPVQGWAPSWPEPGDVGAKTDEARLAQYQAQLDHVTAEAEAQHAVVEARQELDDARATAMWTSLTTIATGEVERARSNADLVQKAAAAIATLYTGALGLVFSASGSTLPLRGLLPVVFLGLAVVLSTVYLAYRPRGLGELTTPNPNRGSAEDEAQARFTLVVNYVDSVVSPRVGALRSSVVALAVGLVLLPVAFVAAPSSGDGAAPAPSTPSLTEWPDPDAAEGVAGRILYEAQVEEVAATRSSERDASAAPAPEDDLGYTLVLLAAGLAVVVLVPTMWSGRPAHRPSGGAPPTR